MPRPPRKDKKIYSYEDVDRMVQQYKLGDRKAIEELFKAFEGFIAKYANFLKFGIYSRADRDLHGLIRMMCPKGDAVRSRLGLIQSALRSYDYEDIIGELNVMFMESALHFQKRKTGPHFSGYLYGYFKFKVKRWMDKTLVDVMNTVKIVELTEEEEKVQMLEDTKDFEMTFSKAKPVLDSVTRWILHLYYYKGMQDKEIGKLVSVSGNWICSQRVTALKKLKTLGYENVIDLIKQKKI